MLIFKLKIGEKIEIKAGCTSLVFGLKIALRHFDDTDSTGSPRVNAGKLPTSPRLRRASTTSGDVEKETQLSIRFFLFRYDINLKSAMQCGSNTVKDFQAVSAVIRFLKTAYNRLFCAYKFGKLLLCKPGLLS